MFLLTEFNCSYFASRSQQIYVFHSGTSSSSNISEILENEFSREELPKHGEIIVDGKCYQVDFENMTLSNGLGQNVVDKVNLTKAQSEIMVTDAILFDGTSLRLIENMTSATGQNVATGNYSPQESVNIRCIKFHNINKIRFDGELPIIDTDIPNHWSPMPDCPSPIFVPIGENSKEFKICLDLLTKNLPTHAIVRLERIQNYFSLKNYCNKKRHILKNLGFSTDLNEQLLFHGTTNRNIRDISTDNLDWRLYGTKSGNVYGEGCYFSNK